MLLIPLLSGNGAEGVTKHELEKMVSLNKESQLVFQNSQLL